MKERGMDETKSVEMARYFATMKIKWDKKPAHDTVNESVFKMLYWNEEKKEINILSRFKYIPELRQVAEDWMFEIFRKRLILYSCFLQKYTKESNIENRKKDGSLVVHVDGSRDTDDLCAVVYTLHFGT